MNFKEGEVLYFDKPLRWTSFAVVNKIRYHISRKLGVKKIKVGHAGTLDPLATGVMIICTGKATKRIEEFQKLACCRRIYPTDANFFLTRVSDAKKIYNYLVDKGIIVRNRSSVTLCQDCLRITIGTRPENDTLLEALKNYKEEEA